MPYTFDQMAHPEKYGLEMCDHCNGYGSSLKDPTRVDRCTKCGGSGLQEKKPVTKESLTTAKRIAVGRHIEGVTLNPLEYLLNNDGSIRTFESVKAAREFLISNSIPEDILDDFTYEEVS
jgi:ribosomal protein L40E